MSDTFFPVTQQVAARARLTVDTLATMQARLAAEPERFWLEQTHRVAWMKRPTTTLSGGFDGDVRIKWFEDGTLNASVSCLDRHLATRGDQVAIIWEGDDPDVSEKVTYRDLYERVCRLANVLRDLGARKGDRICIYLPMVVEAAVAMLACARIGAIHSVVFGGFSPDSLANRIQDSECAILITADEGRRGGRRVALKANADAAVAQCPSIKHVVVVRVTGGAVTMQPGRDHDYATLVAAAAPHCPPEEMGAEDPLFILYTSGSTGKPKGVQHTTGGYMVWASYTHELVFDYRPGEIYWCTADVGWVTGHTYIVYGPLANGATTLMFEGIPSWPDSGRFWQVVDKHQVNIFYTAPTAIRSLMREGEAPVLKHKRSSLRLLGSVGEPINPEAWLWYHRVVGNHRCPIVDTWWQTETGGILITTDRCHRPETRLGHPAATRRATADRRCRGPGPRRRRRGQSLPVQALARHHAHHLRRPRPLHPDLFFHLQGPLFHRRRRAPRRRRLLLDHRAGRRRDQRLRPSHGLRRG